MKADEALSELAGWVGILPEFEDMQGTHHHATPPTQRALLKANGFAAATHAEVSETLEALKDARAQRYMDQDQIVDAHTQSRLALTGVADWHVLSEGDGALLAEGTAEQSLDLPALPEGVHRLHLNGARGTQEVTLISAPSRVPMLTDVMDREQAWGIMAAFYGLRSEQGKSLADYEDLADFSAGLAQAGADFLGINPVHALGTAATETTSPYSPTHRGFLNSDYVATGALLGGGETRGDLVDYRAHRDRQTEALKSAFSRFKESASPQERIAFEAFCQEGGPRLEEFSRFEALSERFGADSRVWPDAVNRASSAPDTLGYYRWLQWEADRQLAAVQKTACDNGMALGLYLDLAVGARVGGAETWGRYSSAAHGVTLGAPPDHLSPAGQDWQLAASSPHKAQATRYEAFRSVLRQNMRHAGVLRIDHALGLNRSFWLPEDGSPGAYMKQPFRALMAIIAIEAKRAGTVIIGEDLGLVPKGFRADMARHGLYGYSVLQYEKDTKGHFLPASRLRSQSLACFGTHDTPTLAGFWHGEDICWWEKLGWINETQAARAADQRASEKRDLAGVPAPQPLPRAATSGLRDAVHARLAESPAAMVAIQLDDILGLRVAQNLPGTVDEHPNWRRIYPQSISQIVESPELQKTAAIMSHAGRSALRRKDVS